MSALSDLPTEHSPRQQWRGFLLLNQLRERIAWINPSGEGGDFRPERRCCLWGVPSNCSKQMINEDQIHLALTAINFLQKRGSSLYQQFMKINQKKILELEEQIFSDESNFRGYSLERKRWWLERFRWNAIHFNIIGWRSEWHQADITQPAYAWKKGNRVGGLPLVSLLKRNTQRESTSNYS